MLQKSCQPPPQNKKHGNIYIYCLISVGYNLSLKNNAGIKSVFSTAQPSMKFTIFNLFGTNFDNLFIFKTFFKYEERFNILNPEYTYSWDKI
jgi:hypothetical protein